MCIHLNPLLRAGYDTWLSFIKQSIEDFHTVFLLLIWSPNED